MIITKCDKCGELIHKADRCLFCGNTLGFTEKNMTITIHENVKTEYESLGCLIENGKFDEALTLSKVVLEWMPSCSEVFWLRFLAKNRCSTDEALICKGVKCEDSADYYNAVLFANEIQKKVYLSVSDKISDVKNVLSRYITEHEYFEKNNTIIVQIQSEYTSEIETRRENLFKLWEEIKQVESQMLAIEKDCLLLSNEYKETLEKVNSEATSIKEKVYKMEQCSAEELHGYQIKFGELLFESRQAKAAIDTMREQHPWIETNDTLIKKRDDIIYQITAEINMLKNYESRVQSVVSEIEQIENRHIAALISVSKYNFAEIRSLLGEALFKEAFAEAGVRL